MISSDGLQRRPDLLDAVPYSLQSRPDLLDAPITIIPSFIASTAPATQNGVSKMSTVLQHSDLDTSNRLDRLPDLPPPGPLPELLPNRLADPLPDPLPVIVRVFHVMRRTLEFQAGGITGIGYLM